MSPRGFFVHRRGGIFYSSGDTHRVTKDGAEGQVLTSHAGARPTFEDAVTAPAGYWSPLTNGDPVAPELIFAAGDTLAVWTPL
jgi:hypothetical protein